jgi:hypothetical protein
MVCSVFMNQSRILRLCFVPLLFLLLRVCCFGRCPFNLPFSHLSPPVCRRIMDLPARDQERIFASGHQSPWAEAACTISGTWTRAGCCEYRSDLPWRDERAIWRHLTSVMMLDMSHSMSPLRYSGLGPAPRPSSGTYVPEHYCGSGREHGSAYDEKRRDHAWPLALVGQITSFAPPNSKRIYIDVFGPDAWVGGAREARVASCPRSLERPWTWSCGTHVNGSYRLLGAYREYVARWEAISVGLLPG